MLLVFGEKLYRAVVWQIYWSCLDERPCAYRLGGFSLDRELLLFEIL
jgi:hypothetical protein